MRTIRAAVVQAASPVFDREAGVEKACRFAAEAAAQNAEAGYPLDSGDPNIL